MADAEESEGMVLVDLCKPYKVDLSKEAHDFRRFFLGYVLLSDVEDRGELKELFTGLYSKLEESTIKNNEGFNEIKTKLTEISNKVPFVYEKDKEKGLVIDLTKLDRDSVSIDEDSISKVITELEDRIKIDPKLEKFASRGKTSAGENKSNNKNKYTQIYKIIRRIHQALNENKPVYVVVPHSPHIYIGKVKNLTYLENVDDLANLLISTYKKLDKKTRKELRDKENWFKQRDFLGQLIQSFEVEDFREYNYPSLPLSFIMSRSQAIIYYKKDEMKFINKVKMLYENKKEVNRIPEELVLNWFTPTSIEELSAILLYYENKDDNPHLKVYHTGGSGDNGFDIIGTEDNKIKFVAQCKTSFDCKDIDSYSKNLDSTIKLYYIVTDNSKECKKKDEVKNVEIWDKTKLLELITKKHFDKIKSIPQYAAILDEVERND